MFLLLLRNYGRYSSHPDCFVFCTVALQQHLFLSCLIPGVNYLVGVVGADVAERGRSRLTEQRSAVALRTIHADVLGLRDLAEQWREDGGRTSCSWGGGCETGQPLR